MVELQSALDRVQELFPGYDLIDQHDGGSQASVYMARHLGTNRTVAIKLLTQGLLARESYRQRFFNEIDLISQLTHENIVTLYDFGEAGGLPYYIMQHVLGMPITDHAFLHDCDVRQCVELFLPVCDAISYAHTLGILHRDIKPSNVIVSEAGQPCVLDFGLGKFLSDDERRSHLYETQPDQIVGTVPYMSPEQASGRKLDFRSDVYSLAVLLYEMITDELPYELSGSKEQALTAIVHEEPAPLRRHLTKQDRCQPQHVNRDLQAIMDKALRKDPNERYQSAAALAAELRHWLAGRAVEARSGSTAYLIRKNVARHPTAYALVGAVVLAGVGLVGREFSLRNRFDDALRGERYLALGHALNELDDRELTLTAYRTAIELGEAAGGRSMDYWEARFLLMSYTKLSVLLLDQEGFNPAEVDARRLEVEVNRTEAGICCTKALELAHMLHERYPNDKEVLALRSRALYIKGDHCKLRQPGVPQISEAQYRESRQYYDEAAAISEVLLLESPDDVELQSDLMKIRCHQASCCAGLKDFDRAQAQLDHALELANALDGKSPSLDTIKDLAHIHMSRAHLRMHRRTASNDAAARQELLECRRLIETPQFQQLKAWAYRRLCDACTENTRLLDARAERRAQRQQAAAAAAALDPATPGQAAPD